MHTMYNHVLPDGTYVTVAVPLHSVAVCVSQSDKFLVFYWAIKTTSCRLDATALIQQLRHVTLNCPNDGWQLPYNTTAINSSPGLDVTPDLNKDLGLAVREYRYSKDGESWSLVTKTNAIEASRNLFGDDRVFAGDIMDVDLKTLLSTGEKAGPAKKTAGDKPLSI